MCLGLAVIMPTPDQCSGPSSPMHTSKNTKETKSDQTDSDKRFAEYPTVVHRVSLILMHCRNKVIQDLLEHKQKELSGSLLATYFYNCMYIYKYFYYIATVTLSLTGLSYCRHRSNLQKNVSHMLLANPLYQLEKSSEILTDEALQLLTDADGRV